MMPIDLIPGTQCDERVWAPLLRHLPPSVPCTFVPLQRAATRRAMAATIADHTSARAHLVAFSMGGYLALEHLLAHPGRVQSLVVIAASANGLGAHERAARSKMLEWLARHDYGGIPASRLAQFVHPSRLDDASVVDPIRAMDRTLGKQVLVAQMRETMDRPGLMQRLHEIRCPVLIVGASDDRLVDVDDLREMNDRIGGSRLCLLPRTGHMIPLEKPQELAELVLSFLPVARDIPELD